MKKNLWNQTNQWSEELIFLQEIIFKCELEVATKWGGPVYTFNKKNIVGVGGFKSYFGIWFFNGVFLKDNYNLLINAQEGTTKSMRQMRFQSIKDVNEKLVLEYIKEAIEIEKKGLVVQPSKKETITSEFLNNEMNLDVKLKNAFEQFSSYKQREFIEYIASAKQEKTKINRFEKIKPMLLENIGLNDKYRK